ncbi:MAG TPA: hypothetical protein PLV52_01580 [Candidatus Omnitrophota bacterium]|nr:hypothetical protein [Candidatus Omnitrophota bacterium]
MKKFLFAFILSCLVIDIAITAHLHAAPSCGTRLPPQKKFEWGYEYNSMFKDRLSHDFGYMQTQDHFITLSCGVADWFSIDGKIGFGDVTQRNGKLPHLDYNTSFAGGYGFRFRVYRNEELGLRGIIGFQHICVHPWARSIDDDKYESILDDWQGSALLAKDFKFVTLYAGMKGSDGQIIYTINKHDKKRVSSDWHLGLITGIEVYLLPDKKTRLSAEGRFFDETALSASVSYLF